MLATAGLAAGMPPDQQTSLVKKYCAVCHSDAANNGALSLEHFDASEAPSSLMAMLLSKLKSGAIHAAGIPAPDQATVDGLMSALAYASTGAEGWTAVQKGNALEASILRQLPAAVDGGARLYRLVFDCRQLQLAWSPVPQNGMLTVVVDGGAPTQIEVQGSEKMGNGSKVVTKGLAAATLTGIPVPKRSLTVSGLFANETVTFPFDNLPPGACR